MTQKILFKISVHPPKSDDGKNMLYYSSEGNGIGSVKVNSRIESIDLSKLKMERDNPGLYTYSQNGFGLEYMADLKLLVVGLNFGDYFNSSNNIGIQLSKLQKQIEDIVGVKVLSLPEWQVSNINLYADFNIPNFLLPSFIESFTRIQYPYLSEAELSGDRVLGLTASYKSNAQIINISDLSNKIRVSDSKNEICRIEIQLNKSELIKRYLDGNKENKLKNIIKTDIINGILSKKVKPFEEFIFMDCKSAIDMVKYLNGTNFKGTYGKVIESIGVENIKDLVEIWGKDMIDKVTTILNNNKIGVLGKINSDKLILNNGSNHSSKDNYTTNDKSKILEIVKTDKQNYEARPYLNVKEASEYMRISEKLVRKLISDGELPYSKIGNRIIIKKDNIDKLIQLKEENSFSDNILNDCQVKKIS